MAHLLNNSSVRSICRIFAAYAVFLLSGTSTTAGPGFNRVYTLKSYVADIPAVTPFAHYEGFVAVADVVDSAEGIQQIALCRFANNGDLEQIKFFRNEGDEEAFVSSERALARVHDNFFVGAGWMYNYSSKKAEGGMIYKFDSSCSVKNTKIVRRRTPGIDTFLVFDDVKYDGKGALYASGILATSPSDIPYLAKDILLVKLDTNFNVLWEKTYHPPATYKEIAHAYITLTDTSVILFGSAESASANRSTAYYRSHWYIAATDTSGKLTWTIANYAPGLEGSEFGLETLVITPEGDFIAAVTHVVRNTSPNPNVTRLATDVRIYRIAKTGTITWTILSDKYPSTLALGRGGSLLGLTDTSFIFFSPFCTDSVAVAVPGKSPFVHKIGVREFSYSGRLVKTTSTETYPFRLPSDTSRYSGSGYWHMIRLNDRGILLSGGYVNATPGADPFQLATLLKLDSTACVGSGAPDCELATSVAEQHQTESFTFTVFPNPATSGSQVHINRGNLPQGESIAARITNTIGQMLFETKIDRSNTLQLPLLSPGLYFLLLNNTDGQTMRQALMIE